MGDISINARRMVQSPEAVQQFLIEHWQDLPETVMRRLPELREWNEIMKRKFELMQEKLAEFARTVETDSMEVTGG